MDYSENPRGMEWDWGSRGASSQVSSSRFLFDWRFRRNFYPDLPGLSRIKSDRNKGEGRRDAGGKKRIDSGCWISMPGSLVEFFTFVLL